MYVVTSQPNLACSRSQRALVPPLVGFKFNSQVSPRVLLAVSTDPCFLEFSYLLSLVLFKSLWRCGIGEKEDVVQLGLLLGLALAPTPGPGSH